MEFRSRSPSETLELAIAAGHRAGITRVSDVSHFAVPGIPVFQATRPASRSLAVSQGKGLTPTAAIIGALLEATELWAGECLAARRAKLPLAGLAPQHIGIWSGDRDKLAINLDPSLPRGWVEGTDLSSGDRCPMPWDLLSLDFTRASLEYPASTCGLACGNTREESLVSGIGELLEHHFVAAFDNLRPKQRRTMQIALQTIDDPAIIRLLALVRKAGFGLRAWSLAGDFGVPVMQVTIFENDADPDEMSPVTGNGCHPIKRVAFARALLEAVQTRAALVAGARDDLTQREYGTGRERNISVLFGTLAFGDGPLPWRSLPNGDCGNTSECLDFLLSRVSEITSAPVVAYDHPAPAKGLHLSHVLGPGLMDFDRAPPPVHPDPAKAVARTRMGSCRARKVLFAGPSISGLSIPELIEVRPPALCGDLSQLLENPPAAVGLVDGYFKLAPTVWHKEILSLMAVGTKVFGGASLGALRAVELQRFGMEGIGSIFAAYRAGVMKRDDAVMLVHAPAELGFAPLSVPLVDAEYTLDSLDLPPRTLRTMQRIVRTTPFEVRDWTRCLDRFRVRTGEEFPIPQGRLEALPSLKRLDASLVVDALAAYQPQRRALGELPPLTCYYRQLLATSAPEFAARLP